MPVRTDSERGEPDVAPGDGDDERIGIAVISAWTEGRGSAMRIRVTTTRDLTSNGETNSVVVRRETVGNVIATWLDGLLDKREMPES